MTRLQHLESAHRGTALHRHFAQVTHLEKACDVLLCGGTDDHTPRLRHLLEPRGQIGGIPHRRVVHAQVIADLADDHEARVDANAHLQAEPALGMQRLGRVTDGALNTQGGVYRSAWAVFVRQRRTEQGHHPVARVLVDGTLEAVHFRRDALEAAVDDVVYHFRVELLGECGEAGHIGEQDGNLLALTFQCAARCKDLLGQMSRRIGQRLACLIWGWSGGGFWGSRDRGRR
jgi:hypothetical protein